MKIDRPWRKFLAGRFQDLQQDLQQELIKQGLETEFYLDSEQDLQDVVQAEKEDIDEVCEVDSQTSEDTHGGSEATCDIENSPNAASESDLDSESNSDSDSESNSESNSDSDSDSESNSESDSDSDSNSNSDSESNSDSDSDSESNSESDSDSDSNSNSESDSNSESESDSNSESESESNSDSDSDSESNSESDSDSDSNSNSDSESNSDSDSESDSEDAVGQKNNRSVFSLEAARQRRLSNAFATVIQKVAEDLDSYPTEGDDEWDVEALMMRRFNRRSLFSCRQSRTKTGVVLVLDTSRSCFEQASFFARIAIAAAQAGDVEMYDAPNAETVAAYKNGHWVQDDTPWWEMKGRTIIFFGDFDGGDALVFAARRNQVYWFSCEDRYEDMTEHPWCHYSLADFRGHYYSCAKEEDFFRLIRKIR